MGKTVILLPKGRVTAVERDSTYNIIYEEERDNCWIKRRQWQKHEKAFEKGKPHVHYYNESGFREGKEFTPKYDIKKALEEIKSDFDNSLDVEGLLRYKKIEGNTL